jgi:hypothetical protein
MAAGFRCRFSRCSGPSPDPAQTMKLNDMREVLTARGIQLTKSLGQNFLHDQNQLRRIVGAAQLSKDDKVLEIGPGLGPLTEQLLDKAGQVLAVETDGPSDFLNPGRVIGAIGRSSQICRTQWRRQFWSNWLAARARQK